jgi:hypothetical protein
MFQQHQRARANEYERPETRRGCYLVRRKSHAFSNENNISKSITGKKQARNVASMHSAVARVDSSSVEGLKRKHRTETDQLRVCNIAVGFFAHSQNGLKHNRAAVPVQSYVPVALRIITAGSGGNSDAAGTGITHALVDPCITAVGDRCDGRWDHAADDEGAPKHTRVLRRVANEAGTQVGAVAVFERHVLRDQCTIDEEVE